jgi:hypothetical protein
MFSFENFRNLWASIFGYCKDVEDFVLQPAEAQGSLP